MEIDPVLLGLIIGLGGPFLVFGSQMIQAWIQRRTAREAAEISRFEAFNGAQENRLRAVEQRAEVLEQRLAGAEEKADKLELTANAQGRYITKLLRIITSHLPELAAEAIAPDPADAPYVTGVLSDTSGDGDVA